MEIITAKEAHERTTYAISTSKENIINLILTDIQLEIGKGNYSLKYCKECVDNWFFNSLLTNTVQEFFKHLGYHYTYHYGNWSPSGDWADSGDYVLISW